MTTQPATTCTIEPLMFPYLLRHNPVLMRDEIWESRGRVTVMLGWASLTSDDSLAHLLWKLGLVDL